MVDTVKLVLDVVAAGMPGVAVYGDELEEGHDPAAQAAVVVAKRGGEPHSEILPWHDDRLQITVWCGKKAAEVAAGYYGTVRGILHGLQGIGGLKLVLETVGGQAVTDPDTGWAKMESFYRAVASDAETVFTPLATTASWGKRTAADNGNGTFTLDQAVDVRTCLVYKNGQKLVLNDDFTLDSGLVTLTPTIALGAGDKLEVYG